MTAMARAAGCASKLHPATLDAVLKNLPRQTNPNVLVGFETNDDAGIYLLAEISRWCKRSISSHQLWTSRTCSVRPRLQMP
jgi:selenophosphate synthase